MSNQHVVVLTDDQINLILRRINGDTDRGLIAQLRAALEHPEGITEDLTRRIESALCDPAQFCARDEGLMAYGEPMDSWQARAVMAALFPGEDEL